MNKLNDRSQNNVIIPVTPNLQQYKLHGKTKNKKKNICPSIQPTLQPINIQQKFPTTPTSGNNKFTICQNHPDRKAMYTTKDNNKKQLCGLCAVTDGGGDSKFLDQQKYEKTKTIEIFKKKVNTLRQNINAKQKLVEDLLRNEQHHYGQYLIYLRTSFQTLIQSIQQKHSQLNNALIQSIQKRKQALNSTTQIMRDIKQSIQRYIFDINKNYQQILAELSIDNFREIMKQYSAKIQYYSENVVKKINNQNDIINIYLPMNEIAKAIDKANIKYLGYENADKMGYTRSLEKYMNCGSGNGKQYKAVKNQKQQKYERHDKNDRKSQSKIQQKRRIGKNIVHPIRGANKQNNYSDLYYNCQFSDQRGYTYE